MSNHRRSSISGFLFAISIIVCPTLAIAANPSTPTSSVTETTVAILPDENSVNTESKRPSAIWSREWLESKGLSFELGYRAETFTNLRGGNDGKRGAEYLGAADLTLQFNLQRMGLGRGSVVVTAQSVHGRSINDRKVGAVQAISNLDNAPFDDFIEAYYTDSYLHGRVTLKAGRLYADADFNVVENGGDFINSSYGLIPTVPMPTYPAPQLGASVWVAATSKLAFGAGLYRGAMMDAPEESISPVRSGPFTIVEGKIRPFSQSASFHGTYRVGLWQQAEGGWDANTLNPSRNYGLYATGDHWFRKATSAGANVGPGVFFQVGWSPSDRNEISSYWGGGFAYPEFWEKRGDDSIGLGVTQARLAGGKRETVAEVFYKVAVNKHVFIQPEVQWINRPAGDGHAALLGGVRMGFSF